jgi:hypothetical protein
VYWLPVQDPDVALQVQPWQYPGYVPLQYVLLLWQSELEQSYVGVPLQLGPDPTTQSGQDVALQP